MRKVMTYKWEPYVHGTPAHKVDDREATFHQFGVSYEEFENGPGNYSTGIIEYADGTVEGLPIEMFRFLDAPSTGAA